jgi:hypothetical protein
MTPLDRSCRKILEGSETIHGQCIFDEEDVPCKSERTVAWNLNEGSFERLEGNVSALRVPHWRAW